MNWMAKEPCFALQDALLLPILWTALRFDRVYGGIFEQAQCHSRCSTLLNESMRCDLKHHHQEDDSCLNLETV